MIQLANCSNYNESLHFCLGTNEPAGRIACDKISDHISDNTHNISFHQLLRPDCLVKGELGAAGNPGQAGRPGGVGDRGPTGADGRPGPAGLSVKNF